MKRIQLIRCCVITILLTVAVTSAAQQITELNSGTIEAIDQEAGYVVINGVTVPYDEGGVTVRYRERQVRTTFLVPGLVVRYRLNQNGTIGEIVLMGPRSMLEQIDQH